MKYFYRIDSFEILLLFFNNRILMYNYTNESPTMHDNIFVGICKDRKLLNLQGLRPFLDERGGGVKTKKQNSNVARIYYTIAELPGVARHLKKMVGLVWTSAENG